MGIKGIKEIKEITCKSDVHEHQVSITSLIYFCPEGFASKSDKPHEFLFGRRFLTHVKVHLC